MASILIQTRFTPPNPSIPLVTLHFHFFISVYLGFQRPFEEWHTSREYVLYTVWSIILEHLKKPLRFDETTIIINKILCIYRRGKFYDLHQTLNTIPNLKWLGINVTSDAPAKSTIIRQCKWAFEISLTFHICKVSFPMHH